MKIKIGVLDQAVTIRANVLLYTVAFAVPLISHGPQLLTGAVVNMLLFIGASTLTRRQLAPLLVLPSIGAVFNGVLFGSLTPYLIYLMPFIWIGNGVLVGVTQVLKDKVPELVSVGIASVAKALLLFAAAQVMFRFGMLPVIFLTAMGVVQLGTALVGGVMSLGANKVGLVKYE